MRPGGINSSTTVPSNVDPDRKPIQTGNQAPVSRNTLGEHLQRFRSGIRGLPGRIKGHFLSLHKQPSEAIPKLISELPKAYSVEVPPPTDAGQKIQLTVDAEIAAFPYHQSLDKINLAPKAFENHPDIDQEVAEHLGFGQWDTARPLALAAGKAAGLSTKGSEGFIYDKKSGLTAYVLHNPSAKPQPEVRLIFGGTTSGKASGGLVQRSLLNRGFTLRQWIANGKNALLGKIPDSYRLASKLTQKVQRLMANDPRYNGYTFTVSGHSKGGGEAAYAALTQKTPIHAICFSSAELGEEVRESLPEATKANAAANVHHYYIEGDAVPSMGDNSLIKLTGSKLGHIGKVTTLPADDTSSSSLDRHDKFTRHIHRFALSG